MFRLTGVEETRLLSLIEFETRARKLSKLQDSLTPTTARVSMMSWKQNGQLLKMACGQTQTQVARAVFKSVPHEGDEDRSLVTGCYSLWHRKTILCCKEDDSDVHSQPCWCLLSSNFAQYHGS